MASSSPCLLLVGTVHLDPHGASKLRTLLAQLEPARITVEISRFGLRFRHRDALPRLAELARAVAASGHPEQPGDRAVALRRMLELPYEYVECARRAEELGVPVDAIDLSRYSYEKLQALAEAFTPDNLAQLLSDETFQLSRAAIEQQLLARRYFNDAHLFVHHFRAHEKAEISARGAAMARALARRLAAAGGGSVVHVGGWHHLLRPRGGGLRTLALHLDALAVPYTRMVLGDRLRPPWGAETP